MANNNQRKAPKFNIFWMYGLIILFLLSMLWMNQDGTVAQEVNWTRFENIVSQGGVKSITVYRNKNKAEALLADSVAQEVFKDQAAEPSNSPFGVGTSAATDKISAQIPSADKFDDYVKTWREQGVFTGEVKYVEGGNDLTMILYTFGPIVLLVALWFFLLKRMGGAGGAGGGIFSVGKSKARLFDKDNDSKVTFQDVAGLAEAKVEIAEIVDFLKNPKHYTELGGKIPKGALLVGPPGTGKTLLAKAVAGEADVPFFSMSGSDFVEMFVGVGASRVRDLFRQAKEKAPCIVFIDEIDAVGRARGNKANLGGNDERESTLNQLLTEMDGFGTNSGVIILAATNRADILDSALLRPGRFDRTVYVGLPDVKGREEILKVHAKGKPLGPDVDLKTIAKTTVGFTGADLENLLNEAALLAARKNKKAITQEEIEEAGIKVMMGPEKKSRVVTEKERKLTAFHEAGHAVATYYATPDIPVHQVSIIPRGQAGGFTMHRQSEDANYSTRGSMLGDIVVLLGGRVAESITLDDISTGASNDLERATTVAHDMVTKYGFSEKMGPVVYDTGSEVFLGRDFTQARNYSDQIATDIDYEIRAIVEDCYAKCEQILTEHRDKLDAVASILLEKEKVDGDEFNAIMKGEEPEEPENVPEMPVVSLDD